MSPPSPGELVVVPRAPGRGVGRLERLLPPGGPPARARIFFYDDGTWGVFPLPDVAPCPPGVWNKEGDDDADGGQP